MSDSYTSPVFDRLDKDKKDRILQAAAREFASLGFNSANTNRIAAKAGISVGSLFKYFGSKEGLFLAVVNLGSEKTEEGIREITSLEIPFFDKIERILRAIQQYSREIPELVNLYNEMTSEGNVELSRRLSGRMEAVSARGLSGASGRGQGRRAYQKRC